MKKIILLLLVSICLGSFLGYYLSKKTKNNFEKSFNNTFNLIKDNSIKRDSIDWNTLRNKVADSITSFKNNDDYYKGIELTLKFINDGHSHFFRPKKMEKLFSPNVKIPKINHKIVGKKIGYIKIPGLFANDSLYREFTLQIRKTLKKLDDTSELSGWIVDLRGNFGGKGTSMILTISPLLTDSIVGYSINNNKTLTINKQKQGSYYLGDKKIDSIKNRLTLKNGRKKIAILIDSTTASAGELLTVALKIKSNSLTFGTKTRGLTSHLFTYNFVSNAKLLLMTQYYCDKNQNILLNGIHPDINCKSENVLKNAISWIE